MKEPLNDWDELQSQWQSYQPDMQKIKSRINWVTWRMRLILLVDVIILVSYFPVIWFLLEDRSVTRLEIVFHVLIGFALVYGVYLDFKIRLPIFRAQGDSTKDVLALYLARVKAGIRLANLTFYASIFLLVFLSVFLVSRYFLSEEPNLERLMKRFAFWVSMA